MSWSLKVSHGDLELSQASFSTVSGGAKLAQDLRGYILEHMGTDDLHPEFGSLLDGGIRNGEYVEGVIGQPNDALSLALVEREIRRLVADYQARQLTRARNDAAIYGKATLSKGEVLLSLSRIDTTQADDTMYITLNILTGDGSAISLDLAL